MMPPALAGAAVKPKKMLPLRKGEYSKRTVWEPMGRSPGNTPQAQIQFIQALMPFILNPQLAQAYGIDGRAVLKIMIAAGPLANAKDILKSDEEMQKDAANAAAAAQAQPGLGATNPAGGPGPVLPLPPGQTPPVGPAGNPGNPPGAM
jgi:hypothetical protein